MARLQPGNPREMKEKARNVQRTVQAESVVKMDVRLVSGRSDSQVFSRSQTINDRSGSGPPTSIALATGPTPTPAASVAHDSTADDPFTGVGTSTFSDLSTAPNGATTNPPIPTNLVLATTTSTSTPKPSSTSSPTPTSTSTSAPAAKSSSQKLTPYLIAAGSVGGFLITILILFIILRCAKRGSGGLFGSRKSTKESAQRQSIKASPSDWNDTMTFAAPVKPKEEDSSELGSFKYPFSSGGPNPQEHAMVTPPLQAAERSFIGRERGDLVHATISRHPLATLDEHSFFREEEEEGPEEHGHGRGAPNDYPLDNYSSNNYPPQNNPSGNYDYNNYPPNNFSQPSYGPPRPSLAQQISNGASSKRISPGESSLSSGFGEASLPPPMPSPENSLYVRPLDTRRSRIRDTWKLSRLSSAPSNAPHTPPSSLRESLATSLGTPRESVARFRSVHGWVDYQSSRADTSSAREEFDVPVQGRNEERGMDSRIDNRTSGSTSTPFGLQAAREEQRDDAARQSWVTECNPASDNEDIFAPDLDKVKAMPQGRATYTRDSARTDTMLHYYSGEDFDFGYPTSAVDSSPVPPLPPLSSRPGERRQHDPDDIRRMDSTSTATVFRFHPGEEVRLGHHRLASEELDQNFRRGPSSRNI